MRRRSILAVLALTSCASTASFTLHRTGAETTLEELRGHVVVLNFWAEWCPPCIGELPAMAELVEREGPGVLLIPAYYREKPLPGAPFYRWLERQPAWFKDRVCWATKAARKQHVMEALPFTVIYGPDGTISSTFVDSIVGREAAFVEAVRHASGQGEPRPQERPAPSPNRPQGVD